MTHVVTIIIGCITAVLTATFAFLLTRLYAGDSIISGFERNAKNAYKHLNRTWYSHHITYDHAKIHRPYWQRGEVTLQVCSGGRIIGLQQDHNAAHDTYDLRGKIRNGQLFLMARANNDTFDAYMACFLNLRRSNLLCGLWIGVNYEREPFCGAYIFSEKELSIQELKVAVNNYHLGAGICADSIWRNDNCETGELRNQET